MARYIARDGTPLSREQWSARQRDRSYCLVKRTAKIGFSIETRWVGWLSDWERGRRRSTFITERYIVRRAGNSRNLQYDPDGSAVWSETEQEALEVHRKFASEVA